MEIKDSGTRRKFETGAVRDMQEGKGRMDLLPWCAIMRVARHFEAGAVKYGDRNWERGIPLSSFTDSAFRHLAKYMDGQDDEDHLCAAAWNLLCALWTEEKRPDLINIPTRPEYAGGAQYGREDEDEMVEKSGWSVTREEDGVTLRNDDGDPDATLKTESVELKKPDWPKANPWLQEPEEIYTGMYAADKDKQLQQKVVEQLQNQAAANQAHMIIAEQEHKLVNAILDGLAVTSTKPGLQPRIECKDDFLLVSRGGWELSEADKAKVEDIVEKIRNEVEFPALLPDVEFAK